MNQDITLPQLGLPEGMIHLGIGQPSPSLLPARLLNEAASDVLSGGSTDYLAYGNARGNPGFRDILAGFLTDFMPGDIPDPRSLFVTNGNSQALDLVCTLFSKPGDTVFVEEPSYFLALDIFRDHGLNLVSIPVDDQGLITGVLAEKLEFHDPAFLYTIPVYHNPASVTLSRERREELVRICGERDLLIVADEVYQYLNYTDEPPPSLAGFCDQCPILSLGSFSKILAPGLRLGWIQSHPDLVKKLAGSGLLVSGGGLNPFTSEIVGRVIETGRLAANIRQLKQVYGDRILSFCRDLSACLPDSVRFSVPDGGYFIWIRFPDGIDTNSFRKTAQKNHVDFYPGTYFSHRRGLGAWMRLSFALYEPEVLAQGARRLGAVISEVPGLD